MGTNNTDLYFKDLLNDIRSKFISVLYNETVRAASASGADNHLIFRNWCNDNARQLWAPNCMQCSGHNCCYWLKVYALRYNRKVRALKEIIAEKGHSACPVKYIRSFLLTTKDGRNSLTPDAHKGLYLLLDFFNIWVWFVDQVNGTAYIFHGEPLPGNANVAYDFLIDQRLYIGKGSTGYALQREKGICMPDAVVDPKGFTVFRNIISSRFSSISVPVRESEDASVYTHLQRNTSKITAFISLSYPAVNAWHPGKRSCPLTVDSDISQLEKNGAEVCFYKKFEHFLQTCQNSNSFLHENIPPYDDSILPENTSYFHLIRYGCEGDLKDRLYEKLFDATNIRTKTVPEFHDVMEKICISSNSNRDALGINYASLWEYDDQKHKYIMKDQTYVSEVAFSAISKAFVNLNRYRRQKGFLPENIYGSLNYTAVMGINEKHIRHIRIPVRIRERSDDLIIELIYYCGSGKLPSVEYIVENECRDAAEALFNIVESVADFSICVYKEAYFHADENLEENRISLLRRKLNRTLCKLFFRQWWRKDQTDYIAGLKSVLDAHSDNLDNLTNEQKERLFLKIDNICNRRQSLIDKIREFSDCELLYAHIWVNLKTVFADNPEIGCYRPAFKEENYRPYLLRGLNHKKNDIVTNLFDHSSYKTFDYAFMYFKEGELIDIRERKDVISNRWTSIFSDHFDFFSYVGVPGDGCHKFGILYKGTIDNALEFICKMKQLLSSLSQKHDNRTCILKHLKSDQFPEIHNDSVMLFHVRKITPFYYIQINNENAFHKINDNPTALSVHPEMANIVKDIATYMKNKPSDLSWVPLFYWSRYEKQGKGGWKPFINSDMDKPDVSALREKLNMSLFNAIGTYALFGCRYQNLNRSAMLLIGRSHFHPENTGEYALFDPNQKKVIGIFNNIIEGLLKYQQFYETGEIEEIVGSSVEIKAVKDLAHKAARYPWTVLILGESGVGKEEVAKAIHSKGYRKGKIVTVNCGAIPDTLVEGELFGYVKGAFTDAKTDKPGKFEDAEGGTLFLDEIGDASPKFQTTILRVLETGKVCRVGGREEKKIDVRVICATNKELNVLKQEAVRNDFLQRISTLLIYAPPLRERKEDIPFLVQKFIRDFNKELSLFHALTEKSEQENGEITFSDDAMKLIQTEDYKEGNVRQLRNLVQRSIMMSGKLSGVITGQDVKKAISFGNGQYDYREPDRPELLRLLEEKPADYFRSTKGKKKKNRMALTGLTKDELETLEKNKLEKLLTENDHNVSDLARKTKISRTELYDRFIELNINQKEIR